MSNSISRIAVDEDLRIAKITGRKVFASDFCPADLKELCWPDKWAHALMIRASCTNRRFKRVRTERFEVDVQPQLITARTLVDKGWQTTYKVADSPYFYLVPEGEFAQYKSQPVAILVFDDFMSFRRCAHALREDRGIVAYGAIELDQQQPSLMEELANWRSGLALSGGAGDKHYLLSRIPGHEISGWRDGKAIHTANGFAIDHGPGAYPAADALYARLRQMKEGAMCVETTTCTQQVDTAFLEPEAGVAYLDAAGKLTMIAGTQSGYSDISAIHNALNLKIEDIRIYAADSGGGFGGRDKSPFAVQLAIAASCSTRPVRLAYDRFEQFQAGMKRHGSAVHSVVSASDDGSLDKAQVHFVFEGGYEPNLGAGVMGLGALHATGMYRYNEASVHGFVTRRRETIVGSMRGFGIPQVMFNLETAIDKLAILKLNVDPIEFRLRNALRWNSDDTLADCDLNGTPLHFHVATGELCERAKAHPLWLERDERRSEGSTRGVLRGVGFAACIEAYGSGPDVTMCGVQLKTDGTFTILSHTFDMGQGARRSLAAAAKRCLGLNSVEVDLAGTLAMQSFNSEIANDPWYHAQKKTEGPNASSASKTAFFHVHVLKEACRAFLQLKVLPAVSVIRKRSVSSDELEQGLREGRIHLTDGAIDWSEVAEKLDERVLIARGYFFNGWTRAGFRNGEAHFIGFVDALGVGRSATEGVRILSAATPPVYNDKSVPRSGYAGGAHLIAVEINPASKSINVTDAVSFLDAGDPIVESVLEGQIEGGFQMGLAHALFEELPPESPDDRYVNFDRYLLPRASDIVDIRLSHQLLPLPTEGALRAGQPVIRHKGVGEVTMTTVAPALANAIAHALGHKSSACWPTKLPIRFNDLELPGT